jgi:hypothetical protein
MSFLNRILPVVEHELETNNSSTAFNGYHLLKADGTDSIALWRVLTVDLEKHKVGNLPSSAVAHDPPPQVVYPDWSKGNHYPGVIVKCDLTRNKERIYDIDLSDGGGRLIGVREEYIRAIVSSELDSRGMRSSATAATSGLSSLPLPYHSFLPAPISLRPISLRSLSREKESPFGSWNETSCLCQKEFIWFTFPSWSRHCSSSQWNHRCRV